MTVLEHLRENRTTVSAPCGGNGTCGKCRVSINGGEPVLACKTEYASGMEIRVLDSMDNIAILEVEEEHVDGEANAVNASAIDANDVNGIKNSGRYGIAIDIGTTTIAGVLCNRDSGKVLASESRINSNISYGADVISRIKAGTEGNGKLMRDNLLNDIRIIVFNLIDNLRTPAIKSEHHIISHDIQRDRDEISIDIIALAGNTTMIHTLMGYDLSSLGVYPYTPVNIRSIKGEVYDILGVDADNLKNTQCVIFPGISTYVGGDIVSGLYYLDLIKTTDIYALIDLGTNGEMAIVTHDTIYSASTSAGPVFEGGGISCGVGSVAGAIDHVKIDDDGKVAFTTISDSKLVSGICGSGVIDCASVIYRTGRCTERGTFTENKPFRIARYPDMNPVYFTQEDMRQVQLAKAAIAAGFETLCHSAGISYDDIGALYLAGGMGYAINVNSAIRIGLIPVELSNKVASIGNSSLKGAIRLLTESSEDALLNASLMAEESKLIDLASDPDFQDSYILHMDFPT